MSILFVVVLIETLLLGYFVGERLRLQTRVVELTRLVGEYQQQAMNAALNSLLRPINHGSRPQITH